MRLLVAFILRWIVTSLGLWIAIQLLGAADATVELSVYLVAGLILSVINILIKPIVSILSLPITILTLGLFTVIVNGLMVYLALQLTPELEITFWSAVFAGIVIGVVNYAINATVETLKTVR